MTVVPYQKLGVPGSAGLSIEQCKRAAWAVEPREVCGEVRSHYRGAAAINASLAVALDVRFPLSFYNLPAVGWFQDRLYDLVAANRRRLPGDMPYCKAHPEECR